MTRRSLPFRPPVRAPRAGFTLLELLTVIAIILVLAGLLLNVAGNANYKSSLSRAQGEVKAMETALESYKADNGSYPRPASAAGGAAVGSDLLNAQNDYDANTSATKYADAGKFLFEALSGTPATGGGTTYGKRYMEFKPSQLNQANGASLTATTTPDGNTLVIDPFGVPYGYSTTNAWAVERGNDPSTYGYNPTFDLWSTAGYGGGKRYPNGVAAASYNTLWVKNW